MRLRREAPEGQGSALPGVEHAEHAQLGTQVSGVGRDLLQGAGAFTEQPCVENLLMRPDQRPQFLGHGEGHQEIRHGQQLAVLASDPLRGLGVTALRTGAMMAGVIGVVKLAAVAAIELAAQSGRATGEDGRHGPAVGRQELVAELRLVRGPMAAEDFRQRDHGLSAARPGGELPVPRACAPR